MFDRRHVLMGLAATPLAACATTGGGVVRNTLSLATFNIWHDRGEWPLRRPLAIQALQEIDADVVGLQEVLQDPATSLPNQAETFAQALGYRTVFVSTDAEDQPRRYGNAILTRRPILEQDWKKLDPLDDFRTAVRIRIDVGGRPVDVVNTHFHHTPEGGDIRRRQIADLLAWLGGRGDVPLIILGDLNASLSRPEMAGLQPPRFRSLLAAVHPDQATATTLNTGYGHRHDQIDHILFEADRFEPLSARITGTQAVDGHWPSDHFPVSGTVRLRA